MKDRVGQLWKLTGLVMRGEGPTVLVLSSGGRNHKVLVLDEGGYDRWPQGSVKTLGEWADAQDEGWGWERLA